MVKSFSDADDPTIPCSYAPLPNGSGYRHLEPPEKRRRRINLGIILALSGFLMICIIVNVVGNNNGSINGKDLLATPTESAYKMPVSRGTSKGVSEKSNRLFLGRENMVSFAWNNTMLSWQRSAYHFQPQKNWMNDPNGPLYYKGWYHFFYQYNPNAAVWGDIIWGHAISTDLINWLHLPFAMVADQWYDINGVWTGSATLLPDGQLIMLYTGYTNDSVQVQNLAYPANLDDPLLINWVKYPSNPVLVPPPGINVNDFRDPTTAWYTSRGMWRITIGSKVDRTGIALVYDTKDFRSYELSNEILHAVPNTGMWECVDFYPVSKTGKNGLDTSFNGEGVKHVLKASMDDDRHDYYAIGTYNEENVSWVPDDPRIDVGIGLRYDYGIFYASKTFYDPKKGRRLLWSWIGESDSESEDMRKGWASLQGIPRTVELDRKTGSNLLQWPVEEIESLRMSSTDFHNVVVKAGSVVQLDVGTASQLDISAELELNEGWDKAVEAEEEFSCTNTSHRGALGPFGILVLADDNLDEHTAVYFYIAKGNHGKRQTFFCTDQSRSSEANDVDKQVYGSTVPVLEGEKLSLRILVDHSIIESFAQGGRTCITARVYPTKAINEAAKVYLFNNATSVSIKASLQIWQMNSAFIHQYTKESVFSFSFVLVSLCFVSLVSSGSGFLYIWLRQKKEHSEPLM